MRVGGNQAMIDWWNANGVDPRASIPVKYAHAATQQYREKIKAAMAGKEYVAPAKSSSSSRGTSGAPAPSSSLSKSSSSASVARKPKSKKSSLAASTGSTATVGTMFSFGDDKPSATSSTSATSDDSDDEAFESFVSAKPTPKAVPNYSDARLHNYASSSSFGSDDLDGTNAAKKQQDQQQQGPSTDDIFSALSTGWAKVAQVASTTKEKLVESTAGLKQKVEQSHISERATSFIQSLWSGMDPTADEQQQQQHEAQTAPQQRVRGEVEGENNADAWLDQPVKSFEGDDGGWGAWDGEKDDDVTLPAPGPAVKKQEDDSWGAWGSKPEEKKKVTTAMMNKKETPTAVLVDFDAPVQQQQQQPSKPASSLDGWDDWAFNKK